MEKYLLLHACISPFLTSSSGCRPPFCHAIILSGSPLVRTHFSKYNSSLSFNFAARICSFNTKSGSKNQSSIRSCGSCGRLSMVTSTSSTAKKCDKHRMLRIHLFWKHVTYRDIIIQFGVLYMIYFFSTNA